MAVGAAQRTEDGVGTSADWGLWRPWVCDFQGEGTAGPAGAEELGTCEDGKEGPLRSVARSGQEGGGSEHAEPEGQGRAQEAIRGR